MEKIVGFIGDNYAWFLTVTIILLFALIGYIYDNRKSKNNAFSGDSDLEEINMENIQIKDTKSLNEVVSNSKNINPETKNVELVDEEILNEEPPVENVTNNLNQ